MPATVTDSTLLVADRLRPVLLRLQRRLRRELRDLDISGIQVSLLGSICRQPGIGLTELAAQEEMSTASLCIHIDKLAAAGLVERVRAEEGDRRRVGLRITVHGKDVFETVRTRRTAWLAERLALLAPDELATVEDAIGPLQRLLEVRP